ncbi:MAG: hypothetical protein IJ228_11155 [Succinivibrio sp.]|nr:hypothetical protein [Succinivibrio sp.]
MTWELLWLTVVPVFLLWRAFCLERAERYHQRLANFLSFYFKDETIPDEDKRGAYAFYRFCSSPLYWLMFPIVLTCTIVKGNRNDKIRNLEVFQRGERCNYGDGMSFKTYGVTLFFFAVASRPVLACISTIASVVPLLVLGVPAVLLSGSPEKLIQIRSWFSAELYSKSEPVPAQ